MAGRKRGREEEEGLGGELGDVGLPETARARMDPLPFADAVGFPIGTALPTEAPALPTVPAANAALDAPMLPLPVTASPRAVAPAGLGNAPAAATAPPATSVPAALPNDAPATANTNVLPQLPQPSKPEQPKPAAEAKTAAAPAKTAALAAGPAAKPAVKAPAAAPAAPPADTPEPMEEDDADNHDGDDDGEQNDDAEGNDDDGDDDGAANAAPAPAAAPGAAAAAGDKPAGKPAAAAEQGKEKDKKEEKKEEKEKEKEKKEEKKEEKQPKGDKEAAKPAGAAAAAAGKSEAVVAKQEPAAEPMETAGGPMGMPPGMPPPAGGAGGGQAGYPRLKVEDALSYLDQVKAQFGNKPQVYNQFLDIMKEFKSQSIDTPGVIKRVSELFEGHPDLIVGFNTFLPPGYKIEVPDQSGRVVYSQPGMPGVTNAFAGRGASPPAQNANGGAATAQAPTAGTPGQTPAPVGTPGSQGGERKQAPEFNHAINYVNKIKTRFAHQLDIYKAFLEILHTYQQERRTIEEVYQQVATLFRNHADLLEEFSQFLPEATTAHQAAMQQQAAARNQAKAAQSGKRQNKKVKELADAVGFQEHAFFDKVKKALRSRQVYENFLRCLNLYSHEIIDRNELVLLVSGFLRRFPELLQWFKNFVGYREGGIERVAGGRPDVDPAQQLDLSQCKRLDTSYRALPESHRTQLCSGRAKLPSHIAGTLNDSWVSFPTIWTEDSPFLVQKKNMYEDAIFRTEDERYELDIVIDTNLSTIRVLEMVMRQLERMTPEQRAAFKFNTKTLGGTSEILHRKAIARLYGEDKLDDVVAALKRDPFTYIPVVLRRLKQKHTEWRNTQRQWNQIWRESNEKNYLKSLDYKYQQFKRNDPVNWKRLKHKMREMRDEYREYRRQKAEGAASGDAPPPPIANFTFSDATVFPDCTRLLLHHLKRSAFGGPEKERMEKLLSNFLPTFLFLDAAEDANAEAGDKDVEMTAADADADADKEADAATTEKSAAAGASASEGGSGIQAVMTKVQRPTKAAEGANTHLFFANNKWYTFHALFQLLYERVLEIKQLSADIAEQHNAQKPKRDERLLPAVSLALRTKIVDVSHDQYFETFLSMTEKFLDNQLDSGAFEDTMREMFNTKAYILFTIDKLIAAIIRQLQTLISDTTSQSLSAAYLQYQAKLAAADTNPGEVAQQYKAHVDEILENNNVFRMEQKVPRTLTIELLDPEADEPEEDAATEKWMKYVEKYVQMQSTDPEIEALLKRPLFLKRNMVAAGFNGDEKRAMENVQFMNKLECKICINTYKLRFCSQSEDYFCRLTTTRPKPHEELERQRHSRFEKFTSAWSEQHVQPEQAEEVDAWFAEGCSAKPCDDGIHTCKRYTQQGGDDAAPMEQ